jgi:AcrR family transcriptional regulator
VSETIVATDRRARRRQEKVARIVEAAWELARRDGLSAISLRDLAERVDLRQPSLYAYFGSKHDLYDAMFADGYRQILRLMRARRPKADPREELVALTADLIRFTIEDVERYQMLFQRTIPGFEPSPASMALAWQFYEQATAALAAAGLTAQTDIDLYSALISGMSHQQVANDPGGDRWVRLARVAVEMLIHRSETATRKGKS